MKLSTTFAVIIAILVSLALPSTSSLIPFLDRLGSSGRGGNQLSDEYVPDPFRILEHIPFGLDRDDLAAVVSPARVDWKETSTAHQIAMDVPGFKRDDIRIEVEDNRVLRVSGERKREEEKKGEIWHSAERVYGRFWRRFRLPDNVDLDSVEAKLDDGVLVVTLSKLPPEKVKGPRVVSIAAGGKGEEQRKGEEKQQLEGGGGEARKIEL